MSWITEELARRGPSRIDTPTDSMGTSVLNPLGKGHPLEQPPRSIFGTKTAFAQYLLVTAGFLTVFFPNAVPWVNGHPGEIMMAAGVVNFVIRRITHGRVVLF